MGRPKGSPNKATAEIKAIAQEYGPEVVEAAVAIMRPGESEQARVAAIGIILDRAYGKASEAPDHQVAGKLIVEWSKPEEGSGPPCLTRCRHLTLGCAQAAGYATWFPIRSARLEGPATRAWTTTSLAKHPHGARRPA
jgi:hypothetical protein